jgi:hypothetical protein
LSGLVAPKLECFSALRHVAPSGAFLAHHHVNSNGTIPPLLSPSTTLPLSFLWSMLQSESFPDIGRDWLTNPDSACRIFREIDEICLCSSRPNQATRNCTPGVSTPPKYNAAFPLPSRTVPPPQKFRL